MSDRSMGKKDNSNKSGKAVRAQEEKRLRAVERQEAYDKLSVEDRIARAKGRPGDSKRELAHLKRSV